MQTELNDLIAILEEQRDHQAALVGLSERKTQAISGGSPQALNEVVEREKAVLALIKAVEHRQDGCVQRLAAALGEPVEAVRMNLVIERAAEPQKGALMKLRAELTDLIDKQQQYNSVNMRLLKMNLDYVQFLLNATAGRSGGATYGQEGGLKPAGRTPRRLLDRKV